jgi:hypothetical protein
MFKHGHLVLCKGLDHKDLKRTHHMFAFKERTTMDFESQIFHGRTIHEPTLEENLTPST